PTGSWSACPASSTCPTTRFQHPRRETTTTTLETREPVRCRSSVAYRSAVDGPPRSRVAGSSRRGANLDREVAVAGVDGLRRMGDRMSVSEVSVVAENLPESQIGLTIEVPPDRVDEAFNRVLNRLSQRVKIEGFRPGKAPRPMVEARVGAVTLREEVIDLLVPPLVNEALRERSIEAIDRPSVEVQEL